METGNHEAALMKFIPTQPGDWSPKHVTLIVTAREVDRLKERLYEDSMTMARKFESYAKDISGGRGGSGWEPTGYSTIRDITINATKLEIEQSQFLTLVRVILGKEKAKEIVTEIANLSAA